MAKTIINTDAARQYATLVTFLWAGKVTPGAFFSFKTPLQAKRYAAFTSRIDTRLQQNPIPNQNNKEDYIYEPVPAMAIEYGSFHGGVRDDPVKIKLPAGLEPFSIIKNGEPFARVRCIIEEIVPGDPSTLTEVFAGQVRRVIVNPGGKSDFVKIEIAGHKNRFEVPLGIPCNTTCAWTFGDKNCCVAIENHVWFGAITSIGASGFDITVPGIDAAVNPPGPGVDLSKFYRRGYIDHDGAKIMIRDYTPGSDSITLTEQVPASWVGDSIMIVPGCDKTIETCRDIWDQEERFGGAGYAIPPYHPVIETG